MSPDDRWLTGYLEDLRDAGDIVAMVVAETDPEKYANSPTGSLALERAVLVHNYDGIARHVLWKAATTDVARVTKEADALLVELSGAG